MLEFRQAETLLWQSCLYHASSSHLSQCTCKGTKWPTSFAQYTLNWLWRMPLRACTGSHSHVTKFLRYSFQRTLEAWPCLTLWGRKTTALASLLSHAALLFLCFHWNESARLWVSVVLVYMSELLAIVACVISSRSSQGMLTLVRAASSTTLLW